MIWLKRLLKKQKARRSCIALGIILCLILGICVLRKVCPLLFPTLGPILYFRVDGVEYVIPPTDFGKSLGGVDIVYAGIITSATLKFDGLEQDDQATFNCLGAPYAIIDGQMMILLDGKWYTANPRNNL